MSARLAGRIRRSVRRASVAGVAAAGLFVAACSGNAELPSCENPRAATSVAMGDFFYEPGCIDAAAGEDLEIVNEGNTPHTFTVEASIEADADVAAGDRATLTVPDIEPGTYRVVCTYHPQMEAALRISG